MGLNDLPTRADWPPAVRELLTRRSRIAVVLCDDVDVMADDIAARCESSANALLRLGSPADGRDIVRAWCGVEPRRPAVAASLLAAARRAAGLGVHPPAATSTVEGRWRFEGSAGRPGVDPVEPPILRALIESDGDDPGIAVGSSLNDGRLTPVERFQQLAGIWGPAAPPILIELADGVRWTAEDVAPLIHAVEVSPQARLMVIASDASWNELGRVLDPHLRAVLEEGLSRITSRSAVPVDGASTAPSPSQVGGTTTERLGTTATAEVQELRRRASIAVDAAARALPLVPPAAPLPPELGQARSLAEALLFAALQSDPRTTGLFRLNVTGGFAFGDRPAEIDLLCASYGIAIEVDGYFHFQDKAAYRRDRAKDYLMQQADLFVLRFLAEDVVDRLEWIVDRISDVVKCRTK